MRVQRRLPGRMSASARDARTAAARPRGPTRETVLQCVQDAANPRASEWKGARRLPMISPDLDARACRRGASDASDRGATMSEITELLLRARAGDRDSLDAVFARLYPELKQLARRRAAGAEATLSPTALVNEAWLKLSAGAVPQLADRQHFLACAARAMRLIVVDEARRVHAAKRGHGPAVAGLDAIRIAVEVDHAELLAIDQALDALDVLDPEQRELVELHWFAGLDFVEIAALRGVNERTVRRGWQRARAFLAAQLGGAGAD